MPIDVPCPATQVRCATGCVDLGTDPDHCGACDGACPRDAHTAPTCAAGACAWPRCAPGWGHCARGMVCETDLAVGSVSSAIGWAQAINCGRCMHNCLEHQVCSDGACAP